MYFDKYLIIRLFLYIIMFTTFTFIFVGGIIFSETDKNKLSSGIIIFGIIDLIWIAYTYHILRRMEYVLPRPLLSIQSN